MPIPSYGSRRTKDLLALLLTIYSVARVLQLYSGRIPTLLIVMLHVVPPALFVLLHGWKVYGLRGILTFTVLCLGTGTFFESLSLRTGFPFGHYFFTDVMGPKLFQLPVLLALAYLGMGYLSWIVASILAGRHDKPLKARRIVLLPLLASCVMVAWDLAMDPVWANLERAWVWLHGGAYFGVPVSNYLGWFLTVYTFYQAFAIYLVRIDNAQARLRQPQSFWRVAVLFYAASAAGNLLLAIPSTHGAFVADPTGRNWSVDAIVTSCALVSVFLMGGFAGTAWLRLKHADATSPS